MDIGDILRLLFFAFVFLSFFGGSLFGRNKDNAEEEQGPAPRPTDIFESGGQDQRRQRPTQARPQQPQRAPQERQMPTTATEWWEELTGQRSQSDPQPAAPTRPVQRQPAQPVATYDDETARGEAERADHRRQRSERATAMAAREAVRSGERAMLEQDISDMPLPMDLRPERRRRQEVGGFTSRRGREIGGSGGRQKRTGGDILRGWLEQPETLERAFIIKEVLDEPLALRGERDVLNR